MSRIKVSIIVPVYNAGKYLSKCLDSLKNQTLKDIEIICVDDGSNDNSADIIRKFQANDGRFVLVKQPNMGVSIARNHGLYLAKGEYFYFIDNDDWIETDTIEKLYDQAVENNIDIVTSNVLFEYENRGENAQIKQPIKYYQVLTQKDKEEYLATFFEFGKCQGAVWNSLYKTERFAGIMSFIPREISSGEDYIFKMIAVILAERVLFVDKCFYHYRVLTDSQSRNRKSDLLNIQIINNIYYISQIMEKNGFNGVEWRQINLTRNIIPSVIVSIKGKSFWEKRSYIKAVCNLAQVRKDVKIKKKYNLSLKQKGLLILYKMKCYDLIALYIN